MKRLAFIIVALTFIPLSAYAGETVSYKDGNVELEGYWSASTCKTSEPAPVVLVIHQWKGLGAYEKRRSDMLADLCYNAFAVDMYGKGIRPANTNDAGKEATKYKTNSPLARQRINAALDYAKTRAGVDSSKIAAIGYCFGGTMALELARSGADIDGVVSFHGGLSTPQPLTKPDIIKASVQINHGADDPLVSAEEVNNFIKEMNTAKADWSLTSYAHAVHSFTEKEAGNDPSKGVAYNEKADIRSWANATAFLKEIFGK